MDAHEIWGVMDTVSQRERVVRVDRPLRKHIETCAIDLGVLVPLQGIGFHDERTALLFKMITPSFIF